MSDKKTFIDKIDKIAEEKGVEKQIVIDFLKTAYEKVYLKENPDCLFEVKADLNSKNLISIVQKKEVVEKNDDEIDDDREILLQEALKIKKSYKIGDFVKFEIDVSKFDKRLVDNIRQVFNQSLMGISREKIYSQWKNKVGHIITATIEKNDEKFAVVNLGDTNGVVLKADQIPREELVVGKRYLFLIKKVEEQSKGWQIILSRADEKLVRFLLIQEVSEISQGLIQIKKIVRVPGYKTKVALWSNQPGINPVTLAVGVGGKKVLNISNQLNNEIIDIFLYDENPAQFLINACHPRKIVGIEILDDDENPQSKIITLISEDSEYEKLVGGKNQSNLKILKKLTGWDITALTKTEAIEDQINYIDTSDLVSSKEKTNYSNKKKPNWNKKNDKNFSYSNKNYYEQDITYNENYNIYSSLTDDDVESVLNYAIQPKNKKKKIEEDEEIVYTSTNNDEKNLLNENKQSNTNLQNDFNDSNLNNKINTKKNKKRIITIDEISDDDVEQFQPKYDLEEKNTEFVNVKKSDDENTLEKENDVENKNEKQEVNLSETNQFEKMNFVKFSKKDAKPKKQNKLKKKVNESIDVDLNELLDEELADSYEENNNFDDLDSLALDDE